MYTEQPSSNVESVGVSLCRFSLQFHWPELDRTSGNREMKMVYKFTYLPAGLFNRGQVSHRDYHVIIPGLLKTSDHSGTLLNFSRVFKFAFATALIYCFRYSLVAVLTHVVVVSFIRWQKTSISTRSCHQAVSKVFTKKKYTI